MRNCENCGKGIMRGLKVSHAKNRSKKIWQPNIHQARVMINGIMKKMSLCTKCLRRLKAKNPIILKSEKTKEKVETKK